MGGPPLLRGEGIFQEEVTALRPCKKRDYCFGGSSQGCPASYFYKNTCIERSQHTCREWCIDVTPLLSLTVFLFIELHERLTKLSIFLLKALKNNFKDWPLSSENIWTSEVLEINIKLSNSYSFIWTIRSVPSELWTTNDQYYDLMDALMNLATTAGSCFNCTIVPEVPLYQRPCFLGSIPRHRNDMDRKNGYG